MSKEKKAWTPPTIQDIDSYLELPKKHLEDMLRLQERIEEIGDSLVSISMRMSPDKVHSNNPVTMEDKILIKMDYEQRWKKSHEKYVKSRQKLEQVFREIPSKAYAELFISRYCECRTIKELETMYGISKRHIYRLCEKMKREFIDFLVQYAALKSVGYYFWYKE